VQEREALALHGRQAIETETVSGDFECAMRNIHSGNAHELLFAEKQSEKPTFAATKIEHARGAAGFQRSEDGAETLFVE
jgi:hypothetical protein